MKKFLLLIFSIHLLIFSRLVIADELVMKTGFEGAAVPTYKVAIPLSEPVKNVLKTVSPKVCKIEKSAGEKVEFGDAIEPNPQVKITRWNGENTLKIKYGKTDFSAPVIVGDRASMSNHVEDVVFYQADTDTFKMIFIFKERPVSNVVNCTLEGWENFDFFYQPPLKNLNPDGSTWEEDGEGRQERPAEINGSYAVYHKTKRNHEVGKTNYMCGKFTHILRPKIWDSAGNWVWANLNITNGNYTVTIPQSFLDSAVYPVWSNDTFGNNNVGASTSASMSINNMSGIKFTCPVAGTATQLSVYYYKTSGTGNVKSLLFLDNGSAYPGAQVAGNQQVAAVSTTQQWADMASTSSLTNQIYWIGCITDSSNMVYKYDTGETNQRYLSYDSTYASPADPFPAGGTGGNRMSSVYVTYTPSGGGSPNPDIESWMFIVD